MVPTAIVKRVKALGLDMIAICDHNTVEIVSAVARAGSRESLTVLPGVESTLELLEQVRAKGYRNIAVVISADRSPEQFFRAARADADDFLVKGPHVSLPAEIIRMIDGGRGRRASRPPTWPRWWRRRCAARGRRASSASP